MSDDRCMNPPCDRRSEVDLHVFGRFIGRACMSCAAGVIAPPAPSRPLENPDE